MWHNPKGEQTPLELTFFDDNQDTSPYFGLFVAPPLSFWRYPHDRFHRISQLWYEVDGKKLQNPVEWQPEPREFASLPNRSWQPISSCRF
jgi:hypothetical protein